jgi:hypothetical protein
MLISSFCVTCEDVHGYNVLVRIELDKISRRQCLIELAGCK